MKRRGRRPHLNIAWVVVGIAVIVTLLFVALTRNDETTNSAAVGPLFEPQIVLPATIDEPSLADASERWGLGTEPAGLDSDLAAAGAALHDLDADGDLDLVVAHDEVNLYIWDDGRFMPPMPLSMTGARAITIADVDTDGWPDLLIARTGDIDTVVWGGEWFIDASIYDTTDLPANGPSAGLLAAELSGDEATDIVRLSRGNGSGETDSLWTADPDRPRVFNPVPLGEDARLSLAGEVVDVDGDGLLDVWVTRDLGWDSGADSVYSRRGDATGPWTDIASELGVALEIDGMGVTLADLDGDLELDAYVSDLGNNEILIREGAGFSSADSTGAARIRPSGTDASVISSSWATGVADLNLDGRLDLVVVNGGFDIEGMTNKIPDTEVALADPPALLIGIGNGQFAETWSAVNLPWTTASRGLAIGDIDGDGDDDLIVVAANGSLTALENLAAGTSIVVTTDPICNASGAIVTVTQSEITFQAPLVRHTYGGQHAPSVVVGRVGPNAVIEAVWPDGTSFVESVSASGSVEIVVPCGATD